MRLRKPPQVADCSGCGTTLAERKRKPCPRCGSTARSVVAIGTHTERLGFKDKA